jgi:hypothetical protein
MTIKVANGSLSISARTPEHAPRVLLRPLQRTTEASAGPPPRPPHSALAGHGAPVLVRPYRYP